MKPNLRSGMLAAAAMAGLVLAGCEANGGPQPGGGGGGGTASEHCGAPFGPGTFAYFGFSCVAGCSGTNLGNINDGDPATFSTLNVTSLGSGEANLYVGNSPLVPQPTTDNASFPAGNIAGFVLEFPGLLEATVLPDFFLQTKLHGVNQERFTFSGIVGAQVLGTLTSNGTFFLGETTTKEFDAVEFGVNVSVNVLNTVNLYEACGAGDQATDLPFILI